MQLEDRKGKFISYYNKNVNVMHLGHGRIQSS